MNERQHKHGIDTEVFAFREKKEDYLKRIYKTNPETNAFVLEVSLDDFSEIFNGWDPSPVKRRDMDPDLVGFLEECASDIPLEFPLELQFYVPKDKYDQDRESLSREGIKNNFDFTVHFIRKELQELRRKILIYAIASLAFLSVGYISRQHVGPNLFTTILIEGLSIGGWVFLWEVFSLIFFSGQEVYGRLRRYKRFQETKITFTSR